MTNLQLIEAGLQQAWFNIQNYDPKERRKLIEQLMGRSKRSGSFIQYFGKYFIAQLIHHSEPYYNGIGTQTRVKQFENAGWYDDKGELIFERVMGL